MSDADKLKQARELIAAKKYSEARRLLREFTDIEHAGTGLEQEEIQTAQRWLKKLDAMQKKSPAAVKPSKMGYVLDRRAVQGAAIGLLAGLIIGGGVGFVAGRDSVINQIQQVFSPVSDGPSALQLTATSVIATNQAISDGLSTPEN